MKQEEILEYNKLCAEFLRMEFEVHSNTWRYKDLITTQLLFHSDWNWIMELAERIKNTTNPKEHSDTTFSTLRREIQTHLGRSHKEAVVEAINQFLIFYNNENT